MVVRQTGGEKKNNDKKVLRKKNELTGTRSCNSLFNACVNVVRDDFSLDATI